ncbi:DUF4366 domain-containing protein [Pseudochryseolinea flava]|uniref:SPOR domain-containing protein n=1 Tax=Pseudochryseolinea flava TaxID=2059302 RepID=A0A364XWU0_9BACT|nr:DUF4366 domain-containing protein [Pseudochryseolinea flava]RAV97997.1 hypothetical protein DQQ10_25680 [Pseudochryseolinea flava]
MARRKKLSEEESQANNNINNESDDTFGLPEIEYEPINREEKIVVEETTTTTHEYTDANTSNEPETPVEQETVQETTFDDNAYTPSFKEIDQEEERSSALPIILVIVGILALAGAGYWYFGIYKPEQKRLELARQAEEDKIAAEAKRRKDAEEAERLRLEREKFVADSIANAKPSVGEIESLTERTGKYYVVVSSAIDDDLIMDYAKELSKKGVSTKIIPPFRKTKFSRLAVDVKDSYDEAQATADGLKGGDYGDKVWVVKY